MKIAIKMKKSSSVDLNAVLMDTAGVTDIKVFDHHATCHIPQEPVAPGGKIEAIFKALGGSTNVKAIHTTK